MRAPVSPNRPGPSFAIYGVALAAMYVGVNLPVALFPLFGRTLAIGPAGLSLLYTIYALATISAMPAMGALSDRIGRRPTIAGGLAMTASGALCMAFAGGLPMLVAGRALQGLSVAAICSPAMAALAESAPPLGRPLAARVATLALAVGAATGALVGGFAVQWASWRQGVGLVGFAVLIAAFLPLLARARETAPTERRTLPQTACAGPRPFAFWQACAASFIAFSVQSTMFTFGTPRLRMLLPHAPDVAAAIGMALYMLASCIAVFATRKLPPARAIVVGPALTSAGVVLLVAAGAAPLSAIAAILVCGAGHGCANVGATARVNELAPPGARGLSTGLYNTVRYVACGAPVFGVGIAASRFGLAHAMLGFTVAVCAMSLALFVADTSRSSARGAAWPSWPAADRVTPRPRRSAAPSLPPPP